MCCFIVCVGNRFAVVHLCLGVGIFVNYTRRYPVRTEMLHWLRPLRSQSLAAHGFIFNTSDVKQWSLSYKSLSEWVVVAYHQWTKSYHSIKSIDIKTGTMIFNEEAPFAYGRFVNNTASERRFYIQNVPELELKAYSQQFRLIFNGSHHILMYASEKSCANLPPPHVVIPQLTQLVSVQHADAISFDTLQFQYTELQCPIPFKSTYPNTKMAKYTCDQVGGGVSGQLLSAVDIKGLRILNCTNSIVFITSNQV